MGRPRRISDERILAAAREVFLEQGYGAPTSEVARRCDCSEGTLFKRYPTKAELFFASMGPECMPDLLQLAEQGLPPGAPRAGVRAFRAANGEHVPRQIGMLERPKKQGPGLLETTLVPPRTSPNLAACEGSEIRIGAGTSLL